MTEAYHPAPEGGPAGDAHATWNPRAPSERRSLILCGAGAIIGLAIAGMGLFTAQGTRIAGVPAEDVALVNQVPILLSDYQQNLRSLYDVSLSQGTPVQKRKVLDDMVREEIYVQRGIELGLQNDVIEVRTALVGSVEGQQAVDASSTQPSAGELHAFYTGNAARYATEGTMTLGDFVAPTIDQARAAVAAVRAGQPVTAAMAAHGLKTSGAVDDGEEFYFAAAIHLGARLFAVARTLTDGQVSDPVSTPAGIHVLAMQHNRMPVSQPFAEVQDRVLTDYRADKIKRMQAGADKFLRKRADVQIAKGFE